MRVLLLLLLAVLTLVQAQKSVRLTSKNDTGCADIKNTRWCLKVLKKEQCNIEKMAAKCKKTCNKCEVLSQDTGCADIMNTRWCLKVLKKEQCNIEKMAAKCQKTCNKCEVLSQDCIGEDCCIKMKECLEVFEAGTRKCDCFHNKCLFSRLCDLHCEHGTCKDGICKCDSHFMGPYCKEPRCTFENCGEHGTCGDGDDGKCTCRDGYYPTDTYSCALDKRVKMHDNIWSNDQCEDESYSIPGLSLSACITSCLDTSGCEAFTYIESARTGISNCSTRKCGEHAHEPNKYFPPYKGISIQKDYVCELKCDRGSCEKGNCNCYSGYTGEYCTEECITKENKCGEKGGFCRKMCHDVEVDFSWAKCSATCDYKCCIPASRFVLTSYNKVWKSSDCSAMSASFYGGSIGECITKCVETDGCTVVSYSDTFSSKGSHCLPRTCDPVPQPDKDASSDSYLGYSINRDYVCETKCDHGTCENRKCNCDLRFIGEYCKEECTPTSNVCMENGGVCMEECDDNYEVLLSAPICYDNCDDYKCCIPQSTAVLDVYDKIWDVDYEDWCTSIDNISANSLPKCLSHCANTHGCTAINYKTTAVELITDCNLFKCKLPVPDPVGISSNWMGYSLNAAKLCDSFHCVHGSCNNGLVCQCDTYYYGIRCNQQCVGSNINVCEKRGGLCRGTCSDREVDLLERITCSDNCKCCMPIDKIIHVSFDGFSWNRDQCNKIEIYNETSFNECLSHCLFTPGCTAINYKETHCVLCALRLPVSAPSWSSHTYNGYLINNDTKCQLFDCDYGTCTNGICTCDSGYYDQNCRTVGCTNCDDHGLCGDDGNCMCNEDYYHDKPIHSCSRCVNENKNNMCGERGGLCREWCTNQEVDLSQEITCSDNCKCCMSFEKIILKSYDGYSWTDDQCNKIKDYSSTSYNGCLYHCLFTTGCTAINYKESHCVLCTPELPVSAPSLSSSYNGSLINIDTLCQLIHCGDYGTCTNGICECKKDSGYYGKHCTRVGCTSTSCDHGGSCGDDGICICTKKYYTTDSHTCARTDGCKDSSSQSVCNARKVDGSCNKPNTNLYKLTDCKLTCKLCDSTDDELNQARMCFNSEWDPPSKPRCWKEGGICRMKCDDLEQVWNKAACWSAEITECKFKCCMPRFILKKYDKKWSPSQCDKLEIIKDTNVANCMTMCAKNPQCTVINFGKDKGECWLRTCKLPVPEPESSLSSWNGYSLNTDYREDEY